MSAPDAGESPTPDQSTTGQYEFGADQNAIMGDLGSKMQFVGMFTIVIGTLGLIGGVLALNTDATRSPGIFIMSLLYIAIGAWTRSAGAGFRQIVATRGADITHLMDALSNVRRVYSLFYWICIIAIALLVISMLIMVFWSAGPEPVRV